MKFVDTLIPSYFRLRNPYVCFTTRPHPGLIKLIEVFFYQLNPLTPACSRCLVKWSKFSWSLDKTSPLYWSCIRSFKTNNSRLHIQVNTSHTEHCTRLLLKHNKGLFNTYQSWWELRPTNLKQRRMIRGIIHILV